VFQIHHLPLAEGRASLCPTAAEDVQQGSSLNSVGLDELAGCQLRFDAFADERGSGLAGGNKARRRRRRIALG
jgi:hypothetical protein